MTRENIEDADSKEQEMYDAGRRDMALEMLAAMGLDSANYTDTGLSSPETLSKELAKSYAKYWAESPDESAGSVEPDGAADAEVDYDLNRMFQ